MQELIGIIIVYLTTYRLEFLLVGSVLGKYYMQRGFLSANKLG